MPLLEDLLSSLGADRWLPGAGAGAAALAAIPAGYWWAVGISAGLAAVALTLRKERAEAITTEEEATQEDAEEEDAVDDNGDSVVSEEVKARTMLRAKAAMQKAAIRQRVEDSLTEEERRTEQMIQAQQLAKIYDLLRVNKEQLGDMSMEDVKKQLSMYKAD